jgi:hypothetical protein
MWLYDAPLGYHQLAVVLNSQEKLAFQGPDMIKWTYSVMPFGPTNGPVTFVNFIYNNDIQWKSLASAIGIAINKDTNTRIIIDDIISHGRDLTTSLLYMECQLCVCMPYCLSLSLKKSRIFPRQFKFGGNDVCSKGNQPAQLKHKLLQTWSKPEIVRDVAKFIGFAQFHSKYIHNFELRISPLQALTNKQEYTEPVAVIWTNRCQRSFDNVREAIISDPCLLRFNHWGFIIHHTDFSSQGFGYVVYQPGTD